MTFACVVSQSVIPLRAQEQTAPSGTPSAAPDTTPANAAPVGPDEVVLTIGEVKVTAAEFEKVLVALPPQFGGTVNSMGKRGFAEQYANLRGLAMEGEKRQIDQSENFQQMMAFQRILQLAQVTLNQLATAGTVIQTGEVTEYYESHQAEFEQLKLRGIFVSFQSGAAPAGSPPQPGGGQAGSAKPQRTETEARAKAESLMNRIRAGEEMATMARTDSDHASFAKSGDFGFVGRSQFTPEIANAVFALKPDLVSEPLRDPGGFFLFRVEEKRVQPLEEAQASIRSNLRQQKLGNVLAKVRSDYPITFNPRYFSESAPAGAATPATPVSPAQ
ncbi:MAG: peptidylprolyl isomerase [Acidobacteria bacterium]|nr:peptidylprolyl isomerase [Acidobacteriota bacterium]